MLRAVNSYTNMVKLPVSNKLDCHKLFVDSSASKDFWLALDYIKTAIVVGGNISFKTHSLAKEILGLVETDSNAIRALSARNSSGIISQSLSVDSLNLFLLIVCYYIDNYYSAPYKTLPPNLDSKTLLTWLNNNSIINSAKLSLILDEFVLKQLSLDKYDYIVISTAPEKIIFKLIKISHYFKSYAKKKKLPLLMLHFHSIPQDTLIYANGSGNCIALAQYFLVNLMKAYSSVNKTTIKANYIEGLKVIDQSAKLDELVHEQTIQAISSIKRDDPELNSPLELIQELAVSTTNRLSHVTFAHAVLMGIALLNKNDLPGVYGKITSYEHEAAMLILKVGKLVKVILSDPNSHSSYVGFYLDLASITEFELEDFENFNKTYALQLNAINRLFIGCDAKQRPYMSHFYNTKNETQPLTIKFLAPRSSNIFVQKKFKPLKNDLVSDYLDEIYVKEIDHESVSLPDLLRIAIFCRNSRLTLALNQLRGSSYPFVIIDVIRHMFSLDLVKTILATNLEHFYVVDNDRRFSRSTGKSALILAVDLRKIEVVKVLLGVANKPKIDSTVLKSQLNAAIEEARFNMRVYHEIKDYQMMSLLCRYRDKILDAELN